MAAEIIILVVIGGTILFDILTRKRRNLSALHAYAREHGWELLLIDHGTYPRFFRSRCTMTYIARYRANDGSVVEA